MKHLNALEHAVIGFFVGSVVSAYVLFVVGTGGYLGSVLAWLSLYPVIHFFSDSSIITLISIVAVFVLYALGIGFLVRKNGRNLFFILPLVIVLAAAVFCQQEFFSGKQYPPTASMPAVAEIFVPPKMPHQYFGMEAVGNLSGAGADDVAFVLSRNYSPTETMYYLAAALSVGNGHQGTNMLYLGDKVIPQSITIKNQVICVSYMKGQNGATSTIYAKLGKDGLEFAASPAIGSY